MWYENFTIPFFVYNKHQRNPFDVFIMHGYEWKFYLSQFGGTSSIMLSFSTRTKIEDEEFHVWWESSKNFQFGMGRDELPVWWYDFHNLIFILYNDKILLFILMGGRRKIKPWDPGILRNDIVQKVATKFGSLQRRHWDLRILLSYLNWVRNFSEGSGIREMTMIRVVQQKHGGKICSIVWCFCLRTSRLGRGGLLYPHILIARSVDLA